MGRSLNQRKLNVHNQSAVFTFISSIFPISVALSVSIMIFKIETTVFLSVPLLRVYIWSVPKNGTSLEKVSKSFVWDKLSFSFNLTENVLRLQSLLMQILFLIILIRS